MPVSSHSPALPLKKPTPAPALEALVGDRKRVAIIAEDDPEWQKHILEQRNDNKRGSKIGRHGSAALDALLPAA